MEMMKKILVVGSLNMDCILEVPHMPEKGETLTGKSVTLIPGGKGANQAYAIGKLGGSVKMIGAVGKDDFGYTLRTNLERVGVDISAIEQMEEEPTGQAFITVDEGGENSIVIIAGTNGMVTKELIQKHIRFLDECDIVIMQLEIPLDVVEYVKDLACERNKMVILDPAPAVFGLSDSFWKGVHYIKPNETELEILVGRKMQTLEELTEGAKSMLDKGVQGVIVTMGSKGCMLVTQDAQEFFEAKKVNAVDTTAAGDCFTAAMAFALSEGKEIHEAIVFGQKVSAIAVTRKGAQSSIPDMQEVAAFYKEK